MRARVRVRDVTRHLYRDQMLPKIGALPKIAAQVGAQVAVGLVVVLEPELVALGLAHLLRDPVGEGQR